MTLHHARACVSKMGVLLGLLAANLACSAERDSADTFGPGAGGGNSDGGAGDDGSGGGSGNGDDGDDGGDGGDPKFDVGGSDLNGGPGDCPGGGGSGEIEFSYIWIANSAENTVSKIDTFTGQELGRYVSGPEDHPDPSRTSVNLYGDAAVSNRGSEGHGSVTKIAARMDDCPDTNGDGATQTSTGPDDVLAWGEDECVLWNTTIPSDGHRNGPRPTAWEGTKDQNGCVQPNPRLWIGWYDQPRHTGKFHRLDGATGQITDSVDVPSWPDLSRGPYGGAVDGNGDFWASGWQQGPLVRIHGDTLAVDVYPIPEPPSGDRWAYGIALDQYGNPWIASVGGVATFDAETEEWSWVVVDNPSMRGLMVDRTDRAWIAVDMVIPGDPYSCGLAVVDVASKTVIEPHVELPDCFVPVGISIDVEGYVWVVDQGAEQAFKVHPDTYEVVLRVEGLVWPYTYSDMTGAGLKLVTYPPQG